MLQQPEGAGGPCALSARPRAGQDWLHMQANTQQSKLALLAGLLHNDAASTRRQLLLRD